jgi:hypothetical protein
MTGKMLVHISYDLQRDGRKIEQPSHVANAIMLGFESLV